MQLLALLVVATALLPTALVAPATASAITGDSHALAPSERMNRTPRQLSNATTLPHTLADNRSVLAILQSRLTMCTYSKAHECVENVTSIPELGVYQQGPGRCVAFDAAYGATMTTSTALSSRYLPIAVEDAYVQGFQNRFSEWSSVNREQFEADCPLLYTATVAAGQDYLCCTESQYENLQTHWMHTIPGQCSACQANLRNVWCQFACNPSNSMFIEVDQVRLVPSDAEHAGAIVPVIEEATLYASSDTMRDLYDYCEADGNVTSAMCSSTQNCTDDFGLLAAMGEYKSNSLGSPLQLHVKTMQHLSTDEQAAKVCACGAENSTGCFLPLNTRLTSCVGVCGPLCAVGENEHRAYHQACVGATSLDDASDSASVSAGNTVDSKWEALSTYLKENRETHDFTVLNLCLVVVGVAVASVLVVGFVLASRDDDSDDDSDSGAAQADAQTEQGRDAEQFISPVDEIVSIRMKQWGAFVAGGKGPQCTIAVVLVLVGACTLGLTTIQVETDPVKLWVSASNQAFKERRRFQELFSTVDRSSQVVLAPKDGGTIGRVAYLKEAIRVQQTIVDVVSGPLDAAFPARVTLDDICWKATGDTSCTVSAITQFFQNRMDHFKFYETHGLALDHLRNCLESPLDQDTHVCTALRSTGSSLPVSMTGCPCLAATGVPMNQYNTVLGGIPKTAETNALAYLEATALVSTVLVVNSNDSEANAPAAAWERAFIARMKLEAAQNELFDVYFKAEASQQDESAVELSRDVFPIGLSYVLVAVYVSLGITCWTRSKRCFQISKITVGVLGVVCITLAVSSTVGVFMWAGVKPQPAVLEVGPFLALAIGVGNVFRLVHATNRMQDELVREEAIVFVGLDERPQAVEEITAVLVSEALGHIGPSIVMVSLAEAAAFAVGCLSSTPAVQWFATFATATVLVNVFLQMTLLVAVIALDKRRELSCKYDVCCWRRAALPDWLKADDTVDAAPTTADKRDSRDDSDSSNDSFRDYIAHSVKHTRQLSNQSRRVSIEVAVLKPSHAFDTCVDAYARFLARKPVKLIVLLAFLLWTLLSIALIEKLRHGFTQVEVLPSASYLISYTNAIDKYLATGAPVFFVVEGGFKRNPTAFNLSDTAVAAKFCRSKDFCDTRSVPNIVDALVNNVDDMVSHLSRDVTHSWLDDFWGFVNPDSECCRVDTSTHAYLPVLSDNASYSSMRRSSSPCLSAKMSSAPTVPRESFMSLFRMFVTASAESLCPFGGGGSIYHGQFSVDNAPLLGSTRSSPPQVVLNSTQVGNQITAFAYKLVSTTSSTPQHAIDGYKQARRAAEWISEATGVDIWAYSTPYIYLDQSLTISADCIQVVGLSIAAIFVVHTVYLNSVLYPLLVSLCAANIVIQVMGLMAVNDSTLNGVSVVNLIIAAGVSVEFCSHFVRMFARSQGATGDARTKDALSKVLVSVLVGVTMASVVGLISALALTDSRVFQTCCFHIFATVVLCGALNGTVFLPVLLSVIEDVRQSVWRRRQRGGTGLRLFRFASDSNEFSDVSPVYRTMERGRRGQGGTSKH